MVHINCSPNYGANKCVSVRQTLSGFFLVMRKKGKAQGNNLTVTPCVTQNADTYIKQVTVTITVNIYGI